MLEYVNQCSAQIKVFGVGGGGSNAVDCMINEGGIGLEGISFICANTDAQALQNSSAPIKLQLGMDITSGLGAGANPEIGERSALADQERIQEVLNGADMVFITAGMGGGTGTGAAPVIAQIAKSLGILTVAVVTKPLDIEGQHRMRSAEYGITELRKYVDSLIEIPNQRLLGQTEGLGLKQTFAFANKVLIDAVKGITEIITNIGMVNVDFADVKTIMSNQGSPSALMGTGIGRGEQRALSAATAAIASPLLNHDISGASAVLMNFTGGPTMTLDEIHNAANTITEKIAGDPVVILGVVVKEENFDDDMIKVTVIATGFPNHAQLDSFDKISSSTRNVSPYDLPMSRPQFSMGSTPPHAHSSSHSSSIYSPSTPPHEVASYKNPPLSTNPPLLHDSSSSSSDEHPKWQAEEPNLVRELQDSNSNMPRDQYQNVQRDLKSARQNQISNQPQTVNRSYQDSKPFQQPQLAVGHHQSAPLHDPFQAAPSVSYPQRNYQQTHSHQMNQSPNQPMNHHVSRPVRSRGQAYAQSPQGSQVLASRPQATQSYQSQSDSTSQLSSSLQPSSARSNKRERSGNLSSLIPVAPVGQNDDQWANSEQHQRLYHNYDRPIDAQSPQHPNQSRKD